MSVYWVCGNFVIKPTFYLHNIFLYFIKFSLYLKVTFILKLERANITVMRWDRLEMSCIVYTTLWCSSYLSCVICDCRGDAGHGGGAEPPEPGGLHRQTDQGVQDRQQTGPQQPEPQPLWKPGGLLPGTQWSWKNHHHVRRKPNCVFCFNGASHWLYLCCDLVRVKKHTNLQPISDHILEPVRILWSGLFPG